jgi:hypothetical protein
MRSSVVWIVSSVRQDSLFRVAGFSGVARGHSPGAGRSAWLDADSAVQLEYSLVERTAERELLPMATAFNLRTVRSLLGGGLLTGKYRKGETGRAQGLDVVIQSESDERKTATVDEVLAISKETVCLPGRVPLRGFSRKGCCRFSDRELWNSLPITWLRPRRSYPQNKFRGSIVSARLPWASHTMWFPALRGGWRVAKLSLRTFRFVPCGKIRSARPVFDVGLSGLLSG